MPVVLIGSVDRCTCLCVLLGSVDRCTCLCVLLGSVDRCTCLCVLLESVDRCTYLSVCVARITDAVTAEARMLAFVEWYLLSFHAGRQVTRVLFIL